MNNDMTLFHLVWIKINTAYKLCIDTYTSNVVKAKTYSVINNYQVKNEVFNALGRTNYDD